MTPRSVRSGRRWLVAAAVSAAGAVAGAVLLVALPGRFLYVDAAPGDVVIVLGILAGLAVVVSGAVGDRAARARNAAASAAVASAAESRRRFLLRLDHELKNPLTAVRAGLATLALLDDDQGAERAQTVRALDAQAVRLSRLVGDLRKIAELETRPLPSEPVAMAPLLEEVCAAAGELAGRAVELTVPKAPWPLPPVGGDRDLLFLAVFNLVANALKFSGPEGTVEVRASDSAPWVAVEVADTGIGIPADEADVVWEELARGREARGLPGTGIGLALVRTVVARHGGTVALRSRAGHGTVVTVRLPAASPAPGPAPRPPLPPPPDVAGSVHPGDQPATTPPYGSPHRPPIPAPVNAPPPTLSRQE